MRPEEQAARGCLVGAVWMLIELCVLACVIQLAATERALGAWALGVFLILLCYFEGRLRK